jgi:hypothetical protein
MYPFSIDDNLINKNNWQKVGEILDSIQSGISINGSRERNRAKAKRDLTELGEHKIVELIFRN